MTEPIYEYTKGQGWQVHTGIPITMSCGTKVVLEFREPSLGEPYDIFYIPQGEITRDIKTYRFEYVSILTQDDYDYYHDSPDPERKWVTYREV